MTWLDDPRPNGKLVQRLAKPEACQLTSYFFYSDMSIDKSKNTYSSSQYRADYIVSDQARSLTAKRARLAADFDDDGRLAQPQRLKPLPPSLNMDTFSLNSNTFDNRKLKADLERAKRWIKQAEESFDELANLRYTAAEKNLENFREKAQERFECKLLRYDNHV